jgi:EAL domain-containing protein (putative c-di-GMP-specific phosphodiesterase class I)
MTATAHQSAASLKSVLNRLRHDHFPTMKFSEPRAGVAVAHDHDRNFTSTFQAIVRASDGTIGGHHALLRAADGHGNEVAPSELFAHATDAAALGHLDRLARAIHAVNYFGTANDAERLFLTIDPRMLASAPDDHRRYFDALLTELDVPTSRVVVCLPEAALEDPVTFVRATVSYAIRGYRVLAEMRPDAHADLEHIFLADPQYVAIDATCLEPSACGDSRNRQVRAIVDSLHSRGIQAVARRIETEAQAQAARDTGFAFLQGRHVAPPAMRPMAA